MKTAVAFAAVFAFALGVLMRDVAQDWKDQAARAGLQEEIRQCQGRGWDMVLRPNAAPMCVAMMPRFEPDWPVQPSPLHLTPKEIRRATR
jgi:hypothetical protein